MAPFQKQSFQLDIVAEIFYNCLRIKIDHRIYLGDGSLRMDHPDVPFEKAACTLHRSFNITFINEIGGFSRKIEFLFRNSATMIISMVELNGSKRPGG